MSVMRKAVEVNVKSVDLEKFTVDADVSSESIDRDGEIILLSSWTKRLAGYMANPLLCWMHPVSSWTARQPEDILGRALVAEVQATSLFCRFQYADRENPTAEMCFNLIAGDYLRSYSIGAIPHGPVYSDYPEVYLNLLPEGAKAALKSGEAWCVHTDMELLEVSNVFVGSNRDALARACRDGVISKSLMPGLYKQINAKSGGFFAMPSGLVVPEVVEAKAPTEIEEVVAKATSHAEEDIRLNAEVQAEQVQSVPENSPVETAICPLELVKAVLLKI